MSTTQRIASRTVPALLALALLLGAGSAASGQGGPKTDEATALIERAAMLRQRIDDLEARAQQARGTDRAVLERRLDEQIATSSALDEQIVELLATASGSKGDPEIREAAVEHLNGSADRFAANAQAQRAELEELHGASGELSGEERARQTQEIARRESRLQDALAAWVAAELRLESLGAGETDRRFELVTTVADRAEMLTGRLELWGERLEALGRAAADEPAERAEKRAALTTLFASARQELQRTEELMGQLGLDTETVGAELVAASGKISEDLLSPRVAIGLAGRTVTKAMEWVESSGRRLAFQLLVFLAVVLLFVFLARAVQRVLTRALSHRTGSKLLQDTAVTWSYRTVLVLGLLLALSQLGVHVTPLLAGLGIAGLVIGLALQDSLSNFVSGLMILFYSPFDVDDVVEVGGVSGTVSAMSLVATEILTFDNQLLVVPNRKVWGEVIRNVTARPERRVDLVFGVSYEDDLKQVERVLIELVAADPRVLGDPEPNIRLHNLGDSSVDFIVRPWVKTEDYWDVYWDLTRAVKDRFDEEGISIPYPQRDLHLRGNLASLDSHDG